MRIISNLIIILFAIIIVSLCFQISMLSTLIKEKEEEIINLETEIHQILNDKEMLFETQEI